MPDISILANRKLDYAFLATTVQPLSWQKNFPLITVTAVTPLTENVGQNAPRYFYVE